MSWKSKNLNTDGRAEGRGIEIDVWMLEWKGIVIEVWIVNKGIARNVLTVITKYGYLLFALVVT